MTDDPRKEFLDAVADRASVDWDRAAALTQSKTHQAWLQNLRVVEALASTLTAGPDLSLPVPHDIGPYRILELIGEGGMGSVFRAEQAKPIRREVAIKVVKLGMDTKRVIARFDMERQALALMNHPNIAKVLDAGATEQGRPFFVMEYVHGVPITEYCDTHRLTTDERLNLMTQVCEGVQHAHQKGIIHRDIKPSNVIVTIVDRRAVPKIIDFGVAKATGGRLTEATMFTELGQMIGTPEYMSPEQAEMSGLDVDTRTDVYSLGVLLYELLVGTRPFDSRDLRRAGYEEIRRRIREEEPSKPSIRLISLGDLSAETARNRRVELSALRRRLRGDLDWIAMKALEKDRTRRYDSPSDLAADIRRHMEHQPALAGPPSTTYRARKFVRRHRIGVAAAGMVMVALLIGVAGTSVGYGRAVRAERAATAEAARANLEANTASQVSAFLVDIFRSTDPERAPWSFAGRPGDVPARVVLNRGARSLRGELKDLPLVRARLMGTIGEIYNHLALQKDARKLLEQALSIQLEYLGDHSVDVARTTFDLALAHDGVDPTVRTSLLERALSIQEELLGPDHPDVARTLSHLAGSAAATGDWDHAQSLFERAIETYERTDDLRLGGALNDYGLLLRNTERLEEARMAHERGVALAERHRDGVGLVLNLLNLAEVRRLLQFEVYERRELLQRALDFVEPRYGLDHPYYVMAVFPLSKLLEEAEDFDGSQRLLHRLLGALQNTYGPDHELTRGTQARLAECFAAQGDLNSAATAYETLVASYERAPGDDKSGLATILWELARLKQRLGNAAEARALYERSMSMGDGGDEDSAWFAYDRACYSALIGDRDDAIELLQLAYTRGLASRNIVDDPDLLSLHGDPSFNRIVSAVLRRRVEQREPKYGLNDRRTRSARTRLARWLQQSGDYEGSRLVYEVQLELDQGTYGPIHDNVFDSLWRLATLSRIQGDPGADVDYLKALEVSKQANGEDSAIFSYDQACYHAVYGRSNQAIEYLRQAVDRGYKDDWIAEDTELDLLRGNPEFESIVAEVLRAARGDGTSGS